MHNQSKYEQAQKKFDRREALRKLGKLAVYSAPTLTTLSFIQEGSTQPDPPESPFNNRLVDPYEPIAPHRPPR